MTREDLTGGFTTESGMQVLIVPTSHGASSLPARMLSQYMEAEEVEPTFSEDYHYGKRRNQPRSQLSVAGKAVRKAKTKTKKASRRANR